MTQYKKRNRSDQAVKPDLKNMSAAMSERELVLRLKKAELFDPYVLLPHAELNEIIYRSVRKFVEKYKGEDMTLTIFSEPLNEAIQNTFRQVYRTHYQDEYNKINQNLRRRFIRFFTLLAVSLSAFFLGDWLVAHIAGYNVFLNVIANVGTFCLWEVGYTHFATKDMIEQKKRILRALNATIEFLC